MNGSDESSRPSVEIQSPHPDGASGDTPGAEASHDGSPQIATRSSQKKRVGNQKQVVIMAAGAIVVAILAFVLVSIPHGQPKPKTKNSQSSQKASPDRPGPASTKSSVPVTESSPVQVAGDHSEHLREQDVQRTATSGHAKNSPLRTTTTPELTSAKNLGAIPPFETERDWQAPPYNSEPQQKTESDSLKSDRDLMEKPSLVFVHTPTSSNTGSRLESPAAAEGLGLPTGTRLRARLETVATTALKLPTIAVIEYNYEKDGQILIPAGAKALGHVEQADRTGYLSIRFDTLLMPDGTEVPFEAVATDLHLAGLRGKVEGKNTGKSLLAQSLSGIGQAGALLAGRSSSLNQPFSEQDLIRERLATNIGDESNREVSHLTVAEHLVVSVPAGTPIYVILQHTTKQFVTQSAVSSAGTSIQNQELIQALQKQLSGTAASTGHPEQ